jgi:hypothetical protein
MIGTCLPILSHHDHDQITAMREFSDKIAPHQVAFESFGMKMRICTNSTELLARVEPMMPPGWRRIPRATTEHRLAILAEDNGVYSIYDQRGLCIHDAPGMEYALAMMDSQIQGHVALQAPDFIFVHAGVVADGNRAIVMPGSSFAGKTTLVRALVEAGALYYSDEFAVLDEAGHVRPYPKPLSYRAANTAAVDYSVEQLGGVAGTQPLPVGMVILTRFRPGAEWDPEELSAGTGALALLEHAVPARSRPEQTMRVLTKALKGAVILRGDRGEADDLAGVLLETLQPAA